MVELEEFLREASHAGSWYEANGSFTYNIYLIQKITSNYL